MIEVAAPIENLFRQAEDGMARGDWKLTIDSLQRIIDDPTASLFPRTTIQGGRGIQYESARRQALRRLADLPEEGLRAYRLLYDGRAKGLWKRAVKTHDIEALRVILQHYLLTQYADEAADLLASWALDEGRPLEALSVLKDFLALGPVRDVGRIRIVAKLAAAYSLLGRISDAERVLSEFQDSGAMEEGEPSWLLSLPTTVGRSRLNERQREPIITQWPTIGGSPSRGGRMPVVEPLVEKFTPWRYELPDSSSGLWTRMVQKASLDSLALPTSRLVAAGSRIYVRTSHGLLALHADDLSLDWQMPSPAVIRAARLAQPPIRVPSPSVGLGAPSGDFVGGSIAVAHGLVLTIERHQLSLSTDQIAVGPAVLPRMVNPRLGRFPSAPRITRLVAYDARTGKERWEHGGGLRRDDALAGVTFRSVGMPVGDALWVPYYHQSDLYVGMLDPTDGTLLGRILLCSLTGMQEQPEYTLTPTRADGVIFVPSGQGVFFAIDEADHSLRWAYRYALSQSTPPAMSAGKHTSSWLPSPPIVAGGTVVYAPPDDEKLLAFDRSDGALRWKEAVDGAYLMGGNEDRIWIGGQTLSCLHTLDGQPIWTFPLEEVPTGRAVRCGGRILVPTTNGLLSLDAETGEELSESLLPEQEAPLGNLLCLNEALYSLDAFGVRKFADLKRMYRTASARHEAQPGDVANAIRLARLELLRDAPRKANAVLDLIAPAVSDADARYTACFANARVEALLALSEESDLGDPDRLEAIEHATEAARAPRDRLRCQLALSDRLAAMGRNLPACEGLWKLALSPDADQFLSVADSVTRTVRVEISRRLREILPQLAPEDSGHLQRMIHDRVSAAGRALEQTPHASKPAGVLRGVADLSLPGGSGQRSLLLLAGWNLQRQRTERAEQQLLECVQRDAADGTEDDHEMTLSALMRLALLYSLPMQQATSSLAAVLDTLDQRFGHKEIPSLLRDMAGVTTVSGDATFGEVGAWVRGVRQRLTTEQGAIPLSTRSLDGTVLSANPHPLWMRKPPPRKSSPRIVDFGSSPPSALDDRVVLVKPQGQIICASITDGKELWSVDLRLPESFTESSSQAAINDQLPIRRAVAGGQTAVFRAPGGLFAIGLLTGKRLWVRPFEPPLSTGVDPSPETAMAIEDGLLAAMPTMGRLSLMRLSDGHVIWNRDLRGEPIANIWMVGDRVVTFDERRQRLAVLDREDGRLIGKVLFHQPDAQTHWVRLIRDKHIIVGPDCTSQADSVWAVDVETGESVWRRVLDKPLAQLFQPGEGYVGIGMLGGQVWIVDAASGEVVLDRSVPGYSAAVDGVWANGTLVVQQTLTRLHRPRPVLKGVDIATGEELWERADLAPLPADSRAFQVFGEKLLAAVEVDLPRSKTNKRNVLTKRLALTMIDISTGENVGPVAELPRVGAHERLVGGVRVWPGVVVVATTNVIHALATEAEPRPPMGGS